MAAQKSDAQRLKELIIQLPEVYQPIYGYPEYDAIVARKEEQRLMVIQKVCAAIQHKLGRPVRVLDLGCAQGWLSLNLAQAGAIVLGIDHYNPNIAVCNALASESIALSVRFERADIETFSGRLKHGDFDVFLGLSVFHHLCAKLGREWGRSLIAGYVDKIPNALLELALSSELPAWAKALPENPEYFVAGLPFFTVLSSNATHLQSIRPLYFCSRVFSYHDEEVHDLSAKPALQEI